MITRGELCRISVQALLPLKACKLYRSSSSRQTDRRVCFMSRKWHRESGTTPSILPSFLQCPLIIVLGRCACMYLQFFFMFLLPNALPLWSLCILLNTCSDKQGTASYVCVPLPSTTTRSHRADLRRSSRSPYLLALFVD